MRLTPDAEQRLEGLMTALLAPTPTPAGVTSREIVARAIEFRSPPRVPYSFIGPLETDFFESAILPAVGDPQGSGGKPEGLGFGETYRDAWGVLWEVTGRIWDHAIEHPLADLSELDRYRFPELVARERFEWMRPYLQRARRAGKYVVAFDPVNVFELARSLMGFEELMMAPYTDPERFDELLRRLTDMTIAALDQFAGMGVDGFMTWQDFGLQTTLQISPKAFREVYQPHYARLVEATHRHGLHFIWHNCGQILDLLPMMIEIGVDVVQLDQPQLMGHRTLAERFGGKICFWNTVDIQWSTGESATAEGIEREVAEMMRAFDRFEGGIIARHYPQPQDIELCPEFHQASYQAFLANGCGLEPLAQR